MKSTSVMYSCLLIGLLTASGILHFSPFYSKTASTYAAAAVLLGLMIIYHVVAFRRSLKIENNGTLADGAYYLGFLYTLGLLCLSILDGGNTEFKQVLNQFALGLITTGYGLFARVQLLSLKESETNLSLEDSLAKQEQLSAKISALSGAIENGTSATNEIFRKQSENIISNVTASKELLNREIASFAELASNFSTRVAGLAETFIPDAEAARFKATIGDFADSMQIGRDEAKKASAAFQQVGNVMNKVIEQTESNLEKVQATTTDIMAGAAQSTAALQALAGAIKAFEVSLTQAGPSDTGASFQLLNKSLEEYIATLGSSRSGLHQMNEATKGIAESSKFLQNAQQGAGEHLNQLRRAN